MKYTWDFTGVILIEIDVKISERICFTIICNVHSSVGTSCGHGTFADRFNTMIKLKSEIEFETKPAKFIVRGLVSHTS